MSRAKRIILRISENDMDHQNLRGIVDFYFSKFPSDAALDPSRHFVHYQPPSGSPQSNPKIHIVIDLETPDFSGDLDKDFPHELYGSRRGANGLEMYAYPEATRKNLLSKIREYSDGFYPWGRTKRDQRAELN
ncbi:hypothetical protein BJY01DRAFT_230264 [Aspergillus pseudoustus]|uniref:EthD domain-containing protein n=1 Tax=Aspergillus pseudoustus TaxID=1810923 RepID=A0ABR4IBV7_9EURO